MGRSVSVRSTPIIPSWIRDYRHAAYTNVYERIPDERCLYGTEDLFGDWEGETLFLAKDWGPSCILDDRISRSDSRPFRHDPKRITNKRLVELASSLSGGKLYGSALAGLLRNDGKQSGMLPSLNDPCLQRHLIRLLRWTFDQMSCLRMVVCLGQEGWDTAMRAAGTPEHAGKYAQYRDTCQPVLFTWNQRTIRAISVYHPAARVSRERMRQAWNSIAIPPTALNAA